MQASLLRNRLPLRSASPEGEFYPLRSLKGTGDPGTTGQRASAVHLRGMKPAFPAEKALANGETIRYLYSPEARCFFEGASLAKSGGVVASSSQFRFAWGNAKGAVRRQGVLFGSTVDLRVKAA